MKIYQLYIVALMLFAVVYCTDFYSPLQSFRGWIPFESKDVKNSQLTRRSTDSEIKKIQQTESRSYNVEEPLYTNETEVNAIIDRILNSRRDGRSFGEFDEVYADGNVEQAIEQGDDIQARSLIKQKLCSLGLMSCDVIAKRPLYAPKPPPNFGGRPPYGPPRPMQAPLNRIRPPINNNRYGPPTPPLTLNSFGPPRKVGFEDSKPFYGRPGPVYNGPYLETPPQSEIIDGSISFTKPPPGTVYYGSKPPGPVFDGSSNSPYTFEHSGGEQIQVAGSQQNQFYAQQQSGASASSSNVVGIVSNQVQSNAQAQIAAGLQQHVHHHFHHVEDDTASIKAPSVPIPIGGGNTVNTGFSALAQSSTGFTPVASGNFAQSSAYTSGFNGASQSGIQTNSNAYSVVNTKPNNGIYNNYNGGNDALNGAYQNQNEAAFGESNFGSSSGFLDNYHSSRYKKKELQGLGGYVSPNNAISGGYNSLPQYSDGYDTSRQQIVDCVCVPFNQCPAADRIGRKDDLILNIDPRNLGKDVVAEEVAANVTDSATNKTLERSRRETTETNEEQNTNKEGPRFDHVQVGLSKRILPSFGISFGLPKAFPTPPELFYPGGPYPPPATHIGGFSIDGLNLGLINVNPLFTYQVSKTDIGGKVILPTFNLHITPNAHILSKIGQIFSFKHTSLLDKDTHFHQHIHFPMDAPYLEEPLRPLYYEHHSKDVEIIASKPVFEYHSGDNIYPPQLNEIPESQYGYYSNFNGDLTSNIQNNYDSTTLNDFNNFERNSDNSSRIVFDDILPQNDIYDDSPINTRTGRLFNSVNEDYRIVPTNAPGNAKGSKYITFPKSRRRRNLDEQNEKLYNNLKEENTKGRSIKVEKVKVTSV